MNASNPPILQLQSLVKLLDRVGITAPPRMTNVTATYEAIETIARSDLHVDLRARIEAEQLDATNVAEALFAAATQQAAKSFVRDLALDCEKPLSKIAMKVMRDEGAAVIADLRPMFAEAVAEIRESMGVVGANPEPSVIAELGPHAVAQWQRGEKATRTVNDIKKIMSTLYLAYDPERLIDASARVVDPRSSHRYRQLQDVYAKGPAVIALIRAPEIEVTLNTPADAARIRGDVERQEQAAVDRQREEWREQARVEAEKEWAIVSGDKGFKLPMRPAPPKKTRR